MCLPHSPIQPHIRTLCKVPHSHTLRVHCEVCVPTVCQGRTHRTDLNNLSVGAAARRGGPRRELPPPLLFTHGVNVRLHNRL